jgi:hypothetical protein
MQKNSRKRSPAERMQELDKRIEQLKARKEKLEMQMNEKERKVRTRRLIQIGAIIEKYWGNVSPEEVEIVMKATRKEDVRRFIEKHGKQRR